MTLGENKKMALALIEEYSPTNQYLTDDEDIRNRINLVYWSNYQNLSEKKPIVKTKTITVSDTEEGRLEVSIPSDCRQIRKVIGLDSDNNEIKVEYSIVGKKLYIKKNEGRYYIEYFAYPMVINEDTPDTFYLEIDQDAQGVLVYMVASDILKVDPSSDYTSFLGEYQRRMQEFDSRRTLPSAVVVEE